jgi:serine/threonine protein kinase
MSQIPDAERLRSALQQALAGRFLVEREIARGGMGAVFLARDLALERPVAIKVLLPEIASATLRERFLREARPAAGLARWWHRIWGGRFGRSILRLASVGIAPRSHEAGRAGPTEVVIGDAVEALFRQLPTELHRRFPDLRTHVDRRRRWTTCGARTR